MQTIQQHNSRALLAAQASLEAWINCENLLAELGLRKVGYAHSVQQAIDQCAHLCMETWQALRNRTPDMQTVGVLCIGICEDCAELCEQYADEWMQQCARACRNCANKVADLSLQSVLLQ